MSSSTSSEIVVEAKNLGKAFQLYAHRNDWLKQVLFGWWKAYFKPFWVLRDVSLEVKKGESIGIPAVKPSALQDPTGCGDAYRAGLLFGLSRGLSWAETGRLAALLGSIKIAHRGTQNHHFTPASLAQAFHAAFGHTLSI